MHSAKSKINFIWVYLLGVLLIILACVGWNVWQENTKTTLGELDYVATSAGLISVLPHLDTADSVYTAALTDLQAANYKQAEQGFSQLIGNWDGSDADLTRVRLALAVTYTAMGEYDVAENLYHELNKQYKFVLGKRRIEKLLLDNNEGILKTLRFTYNEPPKDLVLVFEDARKRLQEGDPFISVAACNASLFNLMTIDTTEDMERIGPALEKLKEAYGEEHVATAMAYAVSAYSYGLQGKREDAQANREKAERLFISMLGKQHPTLAYVYLVRETYELPSRIEEFNAENYEYQIKNLSEIALHLGRTVGSEHIETCRYYSSIVDTCVYAVEFHTKHGATVEAEQYKELMLQYCKKTINNHNIAEQKVINSSVELEMIEYYATKGNYQEALKWCLEVRKNYFAIKDRDEGSKYLYDLSYQLVKEHYLLAGHDESKFDHWLEEQTAHLTE